MFYLEGTLNIITFLTFLKSRLLIISCKTNNSVILVLFFVTSLIKFMSVIMVNILSQGERLMHSSDISQLWISNWWQLRKGCVALTSNTAAEVCVVADICLSISVFCPRRAVKQNPGSQCPWSHWSPVHMETRLSSHLLPGSLSLRNPVSSARLSQ